MKKNLLFFLLIIAGSIAKAQTLTIINNSKTVLYFQVSITPPGEMNVYTSLTTTIEAAKTVKYQSVSELLWKGEVPPPGNEYCSFDGIYMDASGACVSKASNRIGGINTFFKRDAVLNIAKCVAGGGDLHLSWSETGKDVTVTIK